MSNKLADDESNLTGQNINLPPIPILPPAESQYDTFVPRHSEQSSFPYLQKDIKLIERMQRLATRYVKGFRRLPYPERLHELKLPSMERHLLRATLITVYNLFHSDLHLSEEELFEPHAAGIPRGHHFNVP